MKRASYRAAALAYALWLASACVGAARAAPPVGYAALHGLELDSHVELRLAGFKALEQQQYERAVELLEQLAKFAPGFLEPRYNRACALAKLGRLADAHAALREVLRTDLVQYERLYRTDDDLEALRRSAYGKQLDVEIEAVRNEVRRALGRGIPTVRYTLQLHEGALADGGLRFQAGVYVHATRRFVPLAMEVDYSQAGTQLVSPQHGVAFGAKASRHDFSVLAAPAPTDLESQSVSPRHENGEIELAPARGGAWWRYIAEWDEVTRDAPAKSSEANEYAPAPWNFMAASAHGATPSARPGAGPRLRVSYGGVLLTYEKPGDFVSGRTLRSAGRSVMLSARHEHARLQWIVPTASGSPGLVISLLRCRAGQNGCDDSGYGHAIDVIGPGGASKPWLYGAGAAMASFERSGAVYVQLSSTLQWSTLRRYARPGDHKFELIMPNVGLVAAPPGREVPRVQTSLPLSQDDHPGDPFALEPARPTYGR